MTDTIQKRAQKPQRSSDNTRRRQEFLQNVTLEMKSSMQKTRTEILHAVMGQPVGPENDLCHAVEEIEAYIAIACENRRRRELLYEKQREIDAQSEIVAPEAKKDMEIDLCGRREAAIFSFKAFENMKMAQETCTELIDFAFLIATHREDAAFLPSRDSIEEELWNPSLSLLGIRLPPSFSLLKTLHSDENVCKVVQGEWMRYLHTDTIQSGQFVLGDILKKTSATSIPPPRRSLGILIVGTSKIGRKKWAREMAKRFNLEFISVKDLIHKAIEEDTVIGTELIQCLERGEGIPSSLYAELIISAVEALLHSERKECISGWMIDGLPCLRSHTEHVRSRMTRSSDNVPTSPLWRSTQISEDCGIDLVIYIDGQPEWDLTQAEDPSFTMFSTRQNAREALCSFPHVVEVNLPNEKGTKAFEAVETLLCEKLEIGRTFELEMRQREVTLMKTEEEWMMTFSSFEARLQEAQCALRLYTEQLQTAEGNNARKSDIVECKAQLLSATEALETVNNEVAVWMTSHEDTSSPGSSGLSTWSTIETFYMESLRRNFSLLTQLRGRVFAFVNESLCGMNSALCLWRVDGKQIVLNAFQKDFNFMNGEIRMEIETKKELYARVDVLYDTLNDIVDQKRTLLHTFQGFKV
uniref:Flagellar protein putative n=1 Tax=Albugo laibachii Nc14 TaxID=890382 RepID=F0WQC7_9STRA|nr:flagellar protein putative [Albugo laibachii Nc14]|eukprot:CCA23535.1 flagellar protein putative [Albugo laibachii Nc14]